MKEAHRSRPDTSRSRQRLAPPLTAARPTGALPHAVDRPVDVLAMPGSPRVAELADLGVGRVSVSASFAFTAFDALMNTDSHVLPSVARDAAEKMNDLLASSDQ